MPTTVCDLFGAVGLEPSGVVRWGVPVPGRAVGDRTTGTGVYLVALSSEPDSTGEADSACSLSVDALAELLEACPGLTLDGARPDAAEVGRRLAAFWCPDEVILYVGLAGPRQRVKVSELADRVEEYYSTRLGARSPHSGGWPLKTLANLNDLRVHYAYCDNVDWREQRMLAEFAQNVSSGTRDGLHNGLHVMPFANLEYPRGTRKNHGIKGARVSRKA